jgi:cytochrome c peroxidase
MGTLHPFLLTSRRRRTAATLLADGLRGGLLLAGMVAAIPAVAEQAMLGEASLTAGVPGTGPITTAEIDRWLSDPKNSSVLEPVLPLGLSQGAGQVTGLDKNPLTRAKIELGRQLYFDPGSRRMQP